MAATAPQSPVADTANASVTLTWTAPASNGGTDRQVRVQRYNGGNGWMNVDRLSDDAELHGNGLTNGTKYSSASSPTTPPDGAYPSSGVTRRAAHRAERSAVSNWRRPGNNGRHCDVTGQWQRRRRAYGEGAVDRS